MDSFNKTNLQNIKDIFEEKTGVALETRRRRQPIRAAMLVAAVLVCSLTMTAFAVSLFSRYPETTLVCLPPMRVMVS